MNGQQFRAFLWLRWRIRVNQLRRGGIANVVILAIMMVGIALLAAGLCLIFFLVGLFALGQASPAVLLYVWDGLVVAFLFFWLVGLVAELQRPESLALDKFLHLPVSLAGGFLINYFSSLFSVNLIIFVPAMVGLNLGLVFSRGPVFLLGFPLLAAFLLMVTSLTYQFQGWLAALMVNKRRRRTVIVLVTFALILLTQLPNLINFIRPWEGMPEVKTPEQAQQLDEQIEETFRLVNLCVPPGWLPLGASAAAEGDVLPALLGTLGMTLIGAASLWRAYRTTVRLYTGHFTGGKRKKAPAPPAVRTGERPAGLLEKHLPGLSEQATAIALGSFRSLLRAPEAKMLLLTPVIMVIVFAGLFFRGTGDMPDAVRQLMAVGGMAMILVTMFQLVGNQFGFDRNGFRVFVLCPASRRDILLGKNLGFAPLVLALCLPAVVLVECFYPMSLNLLLALLPQMVSMYLLFCLMANLLAIAAPMRVAPGAMKPAHASMIPILLQLAFILVFPFVLALTLVPLGIDLLLEAPGVPVCLALSVVECVAIVYLYRWLLTWEGRLLQAQEQRILKIVTTKEE
jgi:hypothetical protein